MPDGKKIGATVWLRLGHGPQASYGDWEWTISEAEQLAALLLSAVECARDGERD